MDIEKVNPNYFSVKNGKFILYGKGKAKIISPYLVVNQGVYENDNGKTILECSFADDESANRFIEKFREIEYKILSNNVSGDKMLSYSSIRMLENNKISFLIQERFRRLEVDVSSNTPEIYLPTIWDVKENLLIQVVFELSSINENENWLGISKIAKEINILHKLE